MRYINLLAVGIWSLFSCESIASTEVAQCDGSESHKSVIRTGYMAGLNVDDIAEKAFQQGLIKPGTTEEEIRALFENLSFLKMIGRMQIGRITHGTGRIDFPAGPEDGK